MGISFVTICTKPPAKFAFISGVAVLLTMMLSITDVGIRSKENIFRVGSVLGCVTPSSAVSFQRSPIPLTTTNLLSTVESPVILFIASPASLSGVLDICSAEIPSESSAAFFCLANSPLTVFCFLAAEIVTSFIIRSSFPIGLRLRETWFVSLFFTITSSNIVVL